MPDYTIFMTSTVFLLTVIFIIWRPRGVNEAVPAALGAVILLAGGIVPLTELALIINTVSGPVITIVSTCIMSMVLGSIGFFRWAALNIIHYAKGSGLTLYWFIVLLCFMMTLFFTNYASILITTPIIVQIASVLNLKPQQKVPYLLSGALVAAASGAPIGVSSLTSLVGQKIVGMDLNAYTSLMFIPAMLSVAFISLLLYWYFYRKIPKKVTVFLASASVSFPSHIPHAYYNPKTIERWIKKHEERQLSDFHHLKHRPNEESEADRGWFRICIAVIVFIRGGLFLGSENGIPMEWIALFGALLMIVLRRIKTGVGPSDLLWKIPWSLVMLAFGLYITVFAVHLSGITQSFGALVKDHYMADDRYAIPLSGILLAIMSSLMNNLPSIMIGALSLTEMGLDQHMVHIAFLAGIMGSEIGSLLSPAGSLAILAWMYMLRKHKINISWRQYAKAAFTVIPCGLLFGLVVLYAWVSLISM